MLCFELVNRKMEESFETTNNKYMVTNDENCPKENHHGDNEDEKNWTDYVYELMEQTLEDLKTEVDPSDSQLIDNMKYSDNTAVEVKLEQCPQCYFKTNSSQEMELHVIHIHKNEVSHKSHKLKKDIDNIVYINCRKCDNGELHENCNSFHDEDKSKAKQEASRLWFSDDMMLKKCNECNFASKLKMHKRKVHNIESKFSFNCDKCQYICKNKELLRMHIEQIHDGILNYCCSTCKYKSYSRNGINIHIKSVHEDESVKIILLNCVNCKLGNTHKRCSSKESKTEFNCKLCPFKSTWEKRGLLIHMRTKHPGEKLFQCDSCQYKSNMITDIKLHKEAKHDSLGFTCENCNFKTKWYQEFNDHMRGIHGIYKNKSKYKDDLEYNLSLCDNCGFSATSKREMRLHTQSLCTGDTNNTTNRYRILQENIFTTNCTICNFEGNTIYQLNTHIYDKHMGRLPVCNVCGIKSIIKLRLDSLIKEEQPSMGVECEHCGHKATKPSQLGTQYPCTLCEYKCSAKRYLSSHKMRVHRKEYLQCNGCVYIADDYKQLKAHKREEKHTPKELNCNICEYKTTTMCRLTTHKQSKHKGVTYHCDQCDYKAAWKNQLTIHKQSKHGVRYDCDQCEYKATIKVHLTTHKQSQHEGVIYECDQCNYKFTTKSHLTTHKHSTHEGVRYECDKCNYKATQKGHLTAHTKTTHEGVRYECEKCNYKANLQINLTKHNQSKHEGVRYKCNQCDYRATQKGNLTTHKQSMHEGVRYNCDQCDYKTTRKGNLTTHKQSIHEGVRYNCDQCEYKTTQKRTLTTHKQTIHEGVRYECDKCNYKATLKGHLKTHKKSTHEGVRYECEKCNYKANLQINLTKHNQSKHEGVKYECESV